MATFVPSIVFKLCLFRQINRK